ncbi:MAG: hypothetical protein ABIL37_01270 [candidate division WOR-3 bacterium]
MERREVYETETYVTDDNKTKLFELMLRIDPVKLDGFEGTTVPLESTTYLTEREIYDYELSLEVQELLDIITKPVRVRNAERVIAMINKKRSSFLAIRRSREGFFIRVAGAPILKTTEVASQKEKEEKKGFLERLRGGTS